MPEWGGSGFISADNNDVTDENIWRGRDAAGLDEHVIAWNIVPWVLGRADKKPSPADLAQGAIELRSLLTLLPDLQVIVLAGEHAKNAWDTHLDMNIGDRYRVLRTLHPAGQSMNRPGARELFTTTPSKAARTIS